MNKKFLVFGLMGVFAIAMVTAAIVTYYGTIEQEMNIELPITIVGETELTNGYSCGVYTGEVITITNDAPFEVDVEITNDAPEGIDVEYVGTLELSKKVVDFGNSPWDLGDDKVEVTYTVVGDSFNAEVTTPITGYELIYYKDNSDRFNDPANAIAISDVSGNLPYDLDGNADEYNMTEIEGYSNAHGAKIWYVPSDAVTSGVIDWSRASEFYFETNVIQYGNDVTIYDSLDITPIYTIDCNYEGNTIVTTTIA